jgi:uncharacterized protein (DUF362 family)
MITRRDFLRMSAGAFVASLLPKTLFTTTGGNSGPLIGVAHGTSSTLVKTALDAIGGITTFVKRGDKVCIKPNISFAANVECGATTSPEIIKQVVELCLDAGASKVIILEHTIQNAQLCVEKSKIEEAIVDKDRVDLLTLTKERQFTEVQVPLGQELHAVKIAKVLQNVDVFINLPTAKSHSGTGVSLGIKNLMGLIWDRGALHRANLHRAIAELGTVMEPDVTIIDATRVLATGGPGGPGKSIKLNTVITGTDPVAVDSYCVGIAQWYNKSWTGSSVKYIVAAAELGLGEIDPGKMRITEIDV